MCALTDCQNAGFNLAGSVGSLAAAYLLVLLTKRIVRHKSKLLKAICYYVTIGMPLIDLLYLSLLCGFFGAGDMNGIMLFGIPKTAARGIYGVIGVINTLILVKYVDPAYRDSFRASSPSVSHKETTET